MKKKLFIPVIIWTFILFLDRIPLQAQMGHPKMNDNSVFKNTAANQLRTDLRKLWEDHGIYTRNVILNIIDDLPGTDAAVERLLKNQEDIGNAIKPVYGEEAGKTLSALLREHILIAAELLQAAKKDDQPGFSEANAKWFKNADEIAAFLSKANPMNWPAEDMKKMMHTHLELTTREAVARLKKDYKADIEAFDNTRAELLEMSDMLAEGIIKQFPGKFKKQL